MCPSEVGELELQMAGPEAGDKEDEADDIEDKADEAMVGSQRKQDLVDQHDMLEVVDDTLAVQEVHGRGEPVPVQGLGSLDIPCATRDGRNCDHLLEGDNLDGGHDGDDVDVAHEQRGKEASNHDKGPESPRYKVGLLLFVVRGRLCLQLDGGLFVDVIELRARPRAHW